MMGLAGSQGPWISFLYFCSPISHQLQIPIPKKVTIPPRITPAIQAPRPPPVNVIKTAPHEVMTSTKVKVKWPRHEIDRRCLLKIGNSPKTSMENKVSENTWVVDGSRDASTVEAISAELVEMDAGRLLHISKLQT
jgi:hypothetical protein